MGVRRNFSRGSKKCNFSGGATGAGLIPKMRRKEDTVSGRCSQNVTKSICIVHTVDQLLNMAKSRGRKCAPLRPLRTPMTITKNKSGWTWLVRISIIIRMGTDSSSSYLYRPTILVDATQIKTPECAGF